MSLKHVINKYRPDLDQFEQIYQELHQHPELSCQETKTAAIVAKHLKALGFTVHRHIGGHGVVGIFQNGSGQTVLLRAELDALPVKEETAVPYRSEVRMVDDLDGVEKPVMHACGHDMNMVASLAASALLVSACEEWSGTLISIFQPNEERAGGARAMVDGGLYDIIPKPNVALAQHVSAHRTGTVSLGQGTILTVASTLSVRVFGRGGHGSEPQNCVDPIVTVGYILTRLQSIVSRNTDPQETAIVTCGSVHGGTAANIIPDHVDLKLNVRSYSQLLHETILQRIEQIIKNECRASQCPKAPEIKISNRFPATINDDGLFKVLKRSFGEHFGENSISTPRATGSEDFSVLADAVGAPYVYWAFGGTDAKKFDDALGRRKLSELPSNHSSSYVPVIEPTLRTGTDAFALAALEFLAQMHGLGDNV